MIRPAVLLLTAALAAPAWACEPSASVCASVRLIEGWTCIDDAMAPGGYRLEQVQARSPSIFTARARTMIRPISAAEGPLAGASAQQG